MGAYLETCGAMVGVQRLPLPLYKVMTRLSSGKGRAEQLPLRDWGRLTKCWCSSSSMGRLGLGSPRPSRLPCHGLSAVPFPITVCIS